MTISTKLFSILTIGFREKGVKRVLYRSIKETGLILAFFVEGHPLPISANLF